MIGDVVGSPGRRALHDRLAGIRRDLGASAVVVNGENAAAGSGLTAALAKEILETGADAITLGDHTWGQKEFAGQIDSLDAVVRPLNYPEGCPGKGWRVVTTPVCRFVIVNLLGRVFMNPVDCPFRAFDRAWAEFPKDLPVIVDFHAEATSEKITFAHYVDGRAAAVCGTHTHVQTSDAAVLPNGTAFITDLGMTGPYVSSIGRDLKPVTKKFLTGMPGRFEVATGPSVIEGAVVDIDPAARKAVSIEAFRWREPAA